MSAVNDRYCTLREAGVSPFVAVYAANLGEVATQASLADASRKRCWCGHADSEHSGWGLFSVSDSPCQHATCSCADYTPTLIAEASRC
jgi:hypothetical protein